MVIACCGTLTFKEPCNQSHNVNPLDQFESVSSRIVEWWIPCKRGVTIIRLSQRSSSIGSSTLEWWNRMENINSFCQAE